MKRVTDFDELSRSILRCMKPGLLTNCTLSGRELRERTLFSQTWDGGLRLLEQMPWGWYLRYYCLNADCPEELPDGTVCETVLRPGQTDEILQNWGLLPVVKRLRLARPADAKKELPLPEPVDPQQVLELLTASFERETGCLPTLSELEQAAEEGRLLSRFDNGAPVGVLHVKAGKGAWELRHLAVKESARGNGVAQSLVKELIDRFGDRNIRLWVREDAPAARHIYEKFGFMPDGFTSTVRKKG